MKSGDFVVCGVNEDGIREYLVSEGEDAVDQLRNGPQANRDSSPAKQFVQKEAKKRGLRAVEVKLWVFRIERLRKHS